MEDSTEPVRTDRQRTRGHAERILQALRDAGAIGCTNVSLWQWVHAVNSRISDLRARGHVVKCVRESPGVYRYFLHEHSIPPSPAPEHSSPTSSPQTPAELPLFATIEEAAR